MSETQTYDSDLLLDLAGAMDEWGTYNEIWAARREREMAEIMAITDASERELSFIREQSQRFADECNHLLADDILYLCKEGLKRGLSVVDAMLAVEAFAAFWNERVVE